MEVDELFDEWERAWSGRDPAKFEPLCAEGFQYEDPLTPEPLHGAGALAAHAERLWTAFPDARVNSTGRAPGRRRVRERPVQAARHAIASRSGASGRPGASCRCTASSTRELRDGRLLRARAFFDVHDAGVQLGVFPKPGTAGQRALLMLRGFGLRNG